MYVMLGQRVPELNLFFEKKKLKLSKLCLMVLNDWGGVFIDISDSTI